MPTQDSYGQGINIAALTDAPDAEKLVKGITDELVPRANMRFASATERNATITSPVAGMEAWLEAEGLKTTYDGSAWVVSASGTNAWTTVGLPAGFTHNGNSNGDFQYRIVNLFGEVSMMLRGAVGVTYAGTDIPNGGVLNTVALPVSARPLSLRTIVVPCSDVSSVRITLKLDIQTGGFLKIYGTGGGAEGTTPPPWIGFNGCFTSL